ncbi:hypothetical protein WR25_08724 [Diploscapter pachys]|uniref:Uncharacterized protein n=1 Tax=Diploscapter pachys TaxID=2018661 RepID=A0A2A2M566_9BILA|nr:hypothetical protein WR25_08724 [Diploscapter pachys]
MAVTAILAVLRRLFSLMLHRQVVVLGIEERCTGAAVVGVVGIALAALLAGNGRVVFPQRVSRGLSAHGKATANLAS